MVSARVIDKQAEEQGDIAIAIDDGIEEGTKRGYLVSRTSDAPIDHVEDPRRENHQAGVEKESGLPIAARVSEQSGSDMVNRESREGAGICTAVREGEFAAAA